MWPNYNYSPQNSSQTYVINPPTRSMRVPVLKEPDLNSEALAYLVEGTHVSVQFQSGPWLTISLPNKLQGYIYATYATPIRSVNQTRRHQANTAAKPVRRKNTFFKGTKETRKIERVRWISAFLLFIFSVVVIAIGTFLMQSAIGCSVSTSSVTCTNSLQILGALLVLFGFGLLMLSTILLTIQLARRFRSYKKPRR